MSGSSGASTAGGDCESGPQFDQQDSRPMTYEEKRALSLGVNMLPGMELREVIKIIQDTQPSLIDKESNEFEIDFETLEPKTLRALERFLRSKLPSYDDLQREQEYEDEL